MPEGDTIFRAARRMNEALSGETVRRFESVFPQLTRIDADTPIAGRTIEEVRSAGKHLIVGLSGDLHLRTHMRMNGSWHLYRPGERWHRRRSDMRIIIETPSFVAVGFSIPVAEFLTSRSLARQLDLRLIGPDLAKPDFDAGEALRRLCARPELEIAEALLNQRLIAGIGNVLKSEVLHFAGVSPFRRTGDLSIEELEVVVTTARKIMSINIRPEENAPGGWSRHTTSRLQPGEGLAVYGRSGKPCFRCGTPLESAKQGPDARLTFWCPSCQAPRPRG